VRADPSRIRFTLRTYDGRIIATSQTDPIKITDDHKTDKVKPLLEGAAVPSMPRTRRGRASAASSRRQSPVRSEVEIVQSRSEAGAVLQRQTPSARAGKPYERPAPYSLNGLHSADSYPGALPSEHPTYRRQHSSSSLHSMSSMIGIPPPADITRPIPQYATNDFPIFEQPHVHGSVSPGSLRRPHLDGFTAMDGTTSYPSSAAHSANSSNVASPTSQYMGLGPDDLMGGHQMQSANELIQALNFASLTDFAQHQQPSPQAPMISGFHPDHTDIDMTNVLGDSYNQSGHASFASSFTDDVSGFSAGFPEGSLFSESGLVPEADDMTNFLDFTGGQEQSLNQTDTAA